MIFTPSPSAAAAVLMLLPICQGSAATLVPNWDGEPNTTATLVTFTSGSNTPVPDAGSSNPYGVASITVANDTVWGQGWHDPSTNARTYDEAGGAWDLGQSGLISITIPVSAGDSTSTTVEVFLNFIWFSATWSIPSYSVTGLTPESSSIESEVLGVDGPGSWNMRVWNATFENFSGDSITLVLQAPSNGSMVDDVSIYTRVVPEPASTFLLALAATGLGLRRRRL